MRHIHSALMGEPLVELDDLGVRIAGTQVLAGINLRIDPGEVLGVTGSNGAGKTTLLSVIATFIPPSTGTGTVLGATLGSTRLRDVRMRIGFSGHDQGLYPDLTLAENLELIARVSGSADRSVAAVLAAVGLAAAADRRADRASNGMQRRVDLARLLLTRPTLVLLDEAEAGLDTTAEPIVGAVLDRARADGGGAVLVSHDPDRLAGRVDRLLRLEQGTILG